jgi:hypothetical protein
MGAPAPSQAKLAGHAAAVGGRLSPRLPARAQAHPSENRYMYFIYADESGTSGADPIQRFFVLAAIIIRTDNCIRLQEGLHKLKDEFHFKNVEIKGRDIEQSKNFFRHIAPQTKQEFVKRLFELLFVHDLSLVAIVFAKAEETIQRLHLSDEDVYHHSYRELVNHVEDFLATQNDNGLLLIDSRASSIHSHLKDDRLIQVHRDYLKRLGQQRKQTRIIEYPIFIQSEFFAAVQLADLCAYHIFRALQIRYGGGATQSGNPTPAISHEEFQRTAFLDTLFATPDINLPILSRLLTQRGRLIKLP